MKLENFNKVWKEYWVEIILIIIWIAVVHLLLFADAFYGKGIDSTNASEFGSFVNGYIGSLIGLISIILLIRTLKSQIYSSNIDRFESKYFEMIKIHRENASEFNFDKIKGKKVFVKMIREFRLIHKLLYQFLSDHRFTNRKILSIVYLCFYYGIGPNSTRHLISVLRQIGLAQNSVDEIIRKLQHEYDKSKFEIKKVHGFKPFGGHQSRLGHYFRHMYQSINYVNVQSFDDDKKKEYAKMYRAQLTTHEQALLYLNSLCILGEKWWIDEFINKYGMIKNIPENFFDPQTEIDLVEDTKDKLGLNYFEFQKLGDRN